MPRGRSVRSQLLTDSRLGTPARVSSTANLNRQTPNSIRGRLSTPQTARYRGRARGRGTSVRASVSNGSAAQMDTAFSDCFKQLAAELLKPSSRQGGDVDDLKTKCRRIVDKLTTIFPHDPDNDEDKARSRNSLLARALTCAKDTFTKEFEDYGEQVWRSPNLISSMQVLLVIYLSYMPHYAPDRAADTVVCFAVDLIERFDNMQFTEPESQVISLAAIYLRVYYAYNNTGTMIGGNIARPLFSILMKFIDNYIWQEEPFEFLRDLPDLYKMVDLKCRDAQQLDELIDYLRALSTKDVIKALYADTIVFGQHRLVTYNDNRTNGSVDLTYKKFEDWVNFGANNSVDLSNAKEIDRSIDILTQVIACNITHFQILFPAYEAVEVHILPLLYDGIPIFLKLRACYFLSVWLRSFLHRYTYGPSKDSVICSIIDILLNRFQIDRNVSVRFAIARCFNSVYGHAAGRDIAMGATITNMFYEPVVLEFLETFARYPHEPTLALAATYILNRHPSSFNAVMDRMIEILLCLLERMCKRLQFYHVYGFVNNESDHGRDKESTFHALSTLEVILKAAANSKSLQEDYDFGNLEFRVVSILTFIYTNMIIDLKLCAAAFQVQITLGSLVFTDVTRLQLQEYAEELKERIKGLSGDPHIDELSVNLTIWNIRLVKNTPRSTR